MSIQQSAPRLALDRRSRGFSFEADRERIATPLERSPSGDAASAPHPDFYALPQHVEFAAVAWRKLQFLRNLRPTDLVAIGVSDVGAPLSVIDVSLFRQSCTSSAVRTSDATALDDYLTEKRNAGIPSARSFRIWIRTARAERSVHRTLDDAVLPSNGEPWVVRCLLSSSGPAAASLVSGSLRRRLGICVRTVASESSAERESWEREYARNVVRETSLGDRSTRTTWPGRRPGHSRPLLAPSRNDA